MVMYHTCLFNLVMPIAILHELLHNGYNSAIITIDLIIRLI